MDPRTDPAVTQTDIAENELRAALVALDAEFTPSNHAVFLDKCSRANIRLVLAELDRLRAIRDECASEAVALTAMQFMGDMSGDSPAVTDEMVEAALLSFYGHRMSADTKNGDETRAAASKAEETKP